MWGLVSQACNLNVYNIYVSAYITDNNIEEIQGDYLNFPVRLSL